MLSVVNDLVEIKEAIGNAGNGCAGSGPPFEVFHAALKGGGENAKTRRTGQILS